MESGQYHLRGSELSLTAALSQEQAPLPHREGDEQQWGLQVSPVTKALLSPRPPGGTQISHKVVLVPATEE